MSRLRIDQVRDFYGQPHTVVTNKCDGPGCELSVRSSNEDEFGRWGSIIGFVDHDEFGNTDWCSPACFHAWMRQRLDELEAVES